MLHRLVSYLRIYEARMSPALNGSSAIRRFERSDAIEIRNGITFDFYTGLSHIYTLTLKDGGGTAYIHYYWMYYWMYIYTLTLKDGGGTAYIHYYWMNYWMYSVHIYLNPKGRRRHGLYTLLLDGLRDDMPYICCKYVSPPE